MYQVIKYSSLILCLGVSSLVAADSSAVSPKEIRKKKKQEIPQWSDQVESLSGKVMNDVQLGTPQYARQDAFKIMSILMSGDGYQKKHGGITTHDPSYAIRNTGPTKAEWVQIVEAITKSALAFDMDDRVTRLYEYIQGDKDASDTVKNQSRAVSVIYHAARYVMQGGKNMTLNDYVRQSMGNAEGLTDESIQGYIQRHGLSFDTLVGTLNPLNHINESSKISNALPKKTRLNVNYFPSDQDIKKADKYLKNILDSESEDERKSTIKDVQKKFIQVSDKKPELTVPNSIVSATERILNKQQPHQTALTSRIQKMRRLTTSLLEKNKNNDNFEYFRETLQALNKRIVENKGIIEFFERRVFMLDSNTTYKLSLDDVKNLNEYIHKIDPNINPNINLFDMDELLKKRDIWKYIKNNVNEELPNISALMTIYNGICIGDGRYFLSTFFNGLNLNTPQNVKKENAYDIAKKKHVFDAWVSGIVFDGSDNTIKLAVDDERVEKLQEFTQIFKLDDYIFSDTALRLREVVKNIISNVSQNEDVSAFIDDVLKFIYDEETDTIDFSGVTTTKIQNSTKKIIQMKLKEDDVNKIKDALYLFIPETKKEAFNNEFLRYTMLSEFWKTMGEIPKQINRNNIQRLASGKNISADLSVLSNEQKAYISTQPLKNLPKKYS